MADWSDINQTLARMDAKKARSHARLGSSLDDLAQMLFSRRESEKQREFQGDQAEKQREFQGEQARADREYLDTPFADGPRVYEANGEQYTYNTPREYDALLRELEGDIQSGLRTQDADAARELAELNNAARAELQRMSDKAAMARLDAQIEAEIDAARRQWEQRSDEYDSPQSFYSATTGKTYTWNTMEEFELVKQQIEQDNYVEAQRVIAALRGTDEDAASKIREAYEFAKQETLWDATTGTFRDVASMDEEELKAAFYDALGFYELTPEQQDTAYRLFEAFIERSGDGGGGEDGGADFTPVEPRLIDDARGLFDPIRDLLFPREDPPVIPGSGDVLPIHDMPPTAASVTDEDEQDLLARLRSMISNAGQDGDAMSRAGQAMRIIREPGMISEEQYQSIDRMLRQAGL